MDLEVVQVGCPECGVSGESDPQVSRWTCTGCGSRFFLRRCSACTRVSFVDGLQGFRRPWPCTWCGEFNTGFSQDRDPAAASAADLAAELARYGAASPVTASQVNPGPVADSGPPPPPPPRPSGQGATAPRSGPRRGRRIALSAAAVVACAAAAFVVLTVRGPDAAGMPPGQAGHSAMTRTVRIAVSSVSVVDFQGVPGQLTITGGETSQVTLTGQVHGTAGLPVVVTRLDRTAGVLVASIRCASAGPCSQDLRLTVPAGTGTVVRQPGGRVVVAGLAGPLRITAANAEISASGLRSRDLTAMITDGHLSAAFTVPPDQVSITLTSAQAALRLPARVAYRVTQEVASGYVRVAVPQAASAARTVTARLHSGELELLPS